MSGEGRGKKVSPDCQVLWGGKSQGRSHHGWELTLADVHFFCQQLTL